MAVSVKPSKPVVAAPSPAHTLLFGPLGSTDVATAVVHRLRAAIGLGLLPDGERLPKEADLAVQLGITTFALREALAELRKHGLIHTRAGKYGGSFVTHSAEGEDVGRAELLSLSSAELRDLGDWRQMISGQSASLAAVRGSLTNAKTLRSYAQRVGSVDNSLEARRAHGRFNLELASAAQSKRLTRAEFSVHEQIDWLFGLALNTAEARATTSQELAAIADAVAKHKTELARERAERQVTRLVGRLAQLRLELLATENPKPRQESSLESEIRSLVKTLVRELTAIAKESAPALGGDMPFPEARARISLAVLQRFDSFPSIVTGVGVNAEVDVIPSQPYWIQWWRRTEHGPIEDNHHVMDPSHEDFYDYRDMEYMTNPRERRKPWAQGPYVDYGGVDDYILTISVPAIAGGEFRGISLVDVLVSDLESWLAPWLVSMNECVLLNSDNRVIVSNSVRYGVGEVVSGVTGADVVTFPEFEWTLLTSTS